MKLYVTIVVVFVAYIAHHLYTTIPEEYTYTARDFITKYGYNYHAHTVQTEDGFVLTIFRIFSKSKKISESVPVVMGGGLFVGAEVFLHNGPDHDLPYILVDVGFDVWLYNTRGSVHAYAGPLANRSDPNLYAYGYHEMGVYDMPAIIDHVLKMTDQSRVDLLGHSMGSPTALALLSTRPEYNQKIRKLLHFGGSHGVNRNLAYGVKFFYHLLIYLRWSVWLAANPHPLRPYLIHLGCGILYPSICVQSFKDSCGLPSDDADHTLVARIYALSPPGMQRGAIQHYFQSDIYDGEFRMRDWGFKRNMDVYNSVVPPLYNVKVIQVYQKAYYAEEDKLVNNTLGLGLLRTMGVLEKPFFVPAPFEHYNFMSNHARSKPFVDDVIKTLKMEVP